MRAHVVSFSFDGEEVSLNSTSFESIESINMVVLHPNQTELIHGDQNGNIRVCNEIIDSDVGWKLGSCCKQQRNLLCLEALTWDIVTNFEPFTSYRLRMVISSNVSYHPSFVNLSGYTSDLSFIPFGFMLVWVDFGLAD
uniref:Uncharacterized protein n=1 Tax=Lactuca sativa TaxID=4236 RepID=A0A9R1UY47_LACSA|nr:hypothetical protein LSAT_V11C700361150 [Lactuca sativa]